MTKLISGRVKKIPSANVSASRYDFIRLSETEPDLGVPAANGYILTANVDGTRHWVPITPSEATTANFATTAGSANTAVFATTAGSANTSLRANVATQADAANTALTATFATNSNTANTATFATSSSSANTALRANVATQADAANTALTATFATSSTSANTALRANVATLADTANTSLFAENSTTANTVLSISNFTTSNLAEGTNLYYTNARVHSNVVSALSTYTGNIGAGNVTIGSGTGGSLTGANLISAVYISAQNWEGLYTTNVIEGANLYYTTARANAAITLLVDKPFVDSLGVNASTLDGLDSTAFALDTDLTTANVTELNNLYYTNSRVDSFVTPKLTTANVTELTNLYYTNSRVQSNVVNLLPTYSGNINAAYVTATKYFGDGSSLTGVAATAFSGNTDGITEGTTNLFYTNARVRSGISLSTTDPTVLSYNSANGNFAFNLSAVTTDGIAEGTNLYYTNSRVRTAISAGTGVDIDPLLGTISIGQNVATTANVTFGALNVTGPVNFYSNVTTYSSNNLSVSDNMIYLNAGSESSNPDLGIAFNYNDGSYHHAGFFRDASDGIFKVYDNYAPEPDANIFIDTSDASFRLANLSATTFFGNVQGTVSTLSNFTTSDLAEGTNKYFSNALARNALSAGDSTIIYDPIAGTIRATANVTATIESTVNNLSTANVTEAAGNLYYTNARVYSNVLALLPTLAGDNITISANGRISANASSTVLATTVVGLNTANVSESNSNLYYTNARVYSNTLALLPTLAGDNISIAANGRISANTSAILGSITSLSGNIALTGNLLATNGIFAATGAFTGNVAAGNIVTAGGQGGSITGANLLSANNVSATNWIGLYTANVIETSGNLYFTNARVLSNVTAYLAANPITSSYSNANVASYLTSYTGNIQAGNVIANSFISTAPGTGTLTATGDFNIVSGGNIRLTGNVYANTFISTATGAGSLTSTSDFNIIAAGNVSITAPNVLANGTVVANRITANLWSGIYTANVIESASGLYYTNSRVLSNVTAYLAANPISSSYGNANVGSYLASYTGNINAGNIIANAIIAGQGLGGSITGANLISANNISASVITANTIIGGGSGGSVTGANLISTNNISAVNWIGLYTANVVESGSLFYTNSRVYSNVLALLPTLAGDNITIAANGRISATVSATVNVSSIVGLTTANITELNNLYYTNARVLSNVTAYLAANPVTASYGNANVGAYLTTYTGNINAGNVVANAIIAGTGLGGSITGANLISANNISASVITANTIVGAGTGGSITGANLISTNNISSVNWLGLYTANVVETSGNLYFTNARVVSALSAGSGIAISANGQISTTTTLTANAVTGLNTANVNEFGSNLYYTNARVLSNVTAYLAANPQAGSYGNANVGAYLTTYTGNVNAGNVIANSFVATTTGTGTLTATGDFNIVSGGNIRLTGNVYSNTFISTATGAGSITSTSDFNINAASNVTITSSNINLNANNIVTSGNVTAGRISATTWQNLYTANVAETSSGLYYTNARVVSNVIAYLAANPVTASYGNANVAAYLTTYTGNISAGNVIARLIGSASNAIVVTQAAQPAITSVGTLTALNVAADIIPAATTTRGLYGWGQGSALGYTDLLDKSSPVQIESPTTWKILARGREVAAGIKVDGTLWSWGSQELGRATGSSTPAQIGAQTWIDTDSGYQGHAAIRYDNTLWVWGYNGNGQLGLGNTTNYATSPVQVGSLSNWASITVGGLTMFAVKTDGTAWSWGNNEYGKLGLGNTTDRSSPVQIGALTNWSKISSGDTYSYMTGAIKTDGSLWMWGYNGVGCLGLGNTTNYSSPKQVGSLTTWSSLALGELHAAALKTDGTLWAWGKNTYGELGLGNTTFYSSPVQVGGLTTWSKVDNGSNFTAAIKTDGTLWIWGRNNYGQLGQGDTVNKSSPVQVGTATNWANVSAYDTVISALDSQYGNIGNTNYKFNNVYATGTITAGAFSGSGAGLTGITTNTANVIESGNNIFYTNTRVYSNVIALLPTLAGNNITIDANGRISATVSATVNVSSIVGLTTANVAEVGSNLYFTNTRVISALSAGEGITLAANGQISGGVHAITNSQTFAGGNANITLATSVSEAKRIIVTIDGLVQIPVTDYTVSGTTLTLIPTPSPNSTIEVKFFGNEAITTQTFNPFLLAGL